MTKTCGLASAAMLAGIIAGCGGERERVITMADSVDVAAAVPAAPARATPSDAEIAHILAEANGVLLRSAQHARPRVTTPLVAEYTAVVAADHEAMGAALDSLRGAIGLAVAEHVLANELRADGEAAIAELGAATGTAYEEGYIASQIALHEQALTAMDDVLGPHARDARLATFIRNVRPAYAAHFQRALQIRQLLAEGAAQTPASTTGM